MKKYTLIITLLAAMCWLGREAQAATLVNEWKFEGNANDTSGSGNHGTWTGTQAYEAGQWGQCASVAAGSRINKYASAANLPTTGNGAWSMNLWLYLTTTPADLTFICGYGNTGDSGNPITRGLLAFQGGGSSMYFWSQGGSGGGPTSVPYPLNQWCMITLACGGTSVSIYTNGVLISTLPTTTAAIGTPTVRVAGDPGGWGRNFSGKVDEFTIWSGELTPGDIASLYASNSVPPMPPSIVTTPLDASVYPGEYATLKVVADGTAPLSYQWVKWDTNVLAGATNATLPFAPVSTGDAGTYTVIVSNPSGSVTSSPPVTLTVLAVPNIAAGLKGYWPFNETSGTTTLDATGNLNDGMLINFPFDDSQWVAGKIGNALKFRGQGTGLNDFVQVPSHSINPPTTMTIAAWVWADSISTWASIVKNWPGGGGDQVHFGMNSTDGDLSNYLGGPGGALVGPVREGLGALLPLNSWVHVALVCNGQTMQLYRNGAAIGTPVAYGGVINTNTLGNTLGFGAKIGSSGYPPTGLDGGYWKGKMDDIGIWGRGLSKAEILSIYLAGQAGQPLTNADTYSVTLPYISGQPQGVTKYAGEYGASFTVLAIGQGGLSYQWRQGSVDIPDGTNNVLSIPGMLTNSAAYTVVINDAGNGLSVTSAPAMLTVMPVAGITQGLSGYWKFDETNGLTAADSTPNARAATLNSYWDDSMWVPGQIGGSLAFGGAGYSQYATIPDLILATNNTLTVSAWVWADLEEDRASIVDCYGQNPVGQFRFGLGNAASRPLTGGVISQAAGYVAGTEATGFPTGTWQHVALVADGATIRLYRNGSLAATNAYNGTIVYPSAVSNLFVGARMADDGLNLNSVPGFWTGRMDDLGMWARGLTADEVLGIYAAGFNHQPLTSATSTGVKPIISAPPVSLSLTEGEDAKFTVTATGATPLSYQWRKGGAPIAGATNSSYALHSVVLSDAADYTVVVSNFVGSVTSTPAATLAVNVLSWPLPAMTNDLVAYWKFDESAGTNAQDSAGANPGVLNNYPGDNSQWMPGVVGGALAFDGVGEYVYVADYPKPTTNMTVAAWVWADSRPTWASIIKNWANAAGEQQFHFGLFENGGGINNYIHEQDGGFQSAGESTPIPLGSWQHVAFVCDGSQMRVYRNGVQVGSTAYNGTLNTSPLGASLSIGAKLESPGVAVSFWQGKMDDIGLWTRGLSSVEIQSLYSSGLEGRNIENASPSPSLQLLSDGGNLVFSWPEAPLGRGFVLESSTTLPAASWVPVAAAMTVNAGRCTVTVPSATAGNQFYRLRQ